MFNSVRIQDSPLCRRYPVAQREVIVERSDGRHHLQDRNHEADGRLKGLDKQNLIVHVEAFSIIL